MGAPEIIKTALGGRRLKLSCLSYIMETGRIRANSSCEFRIKIGHHGTTGGLPYWNWNGDESNPTVTPSIACQICGLHVTVSNGQESGRPSGPYTMRNHSKDGNVYDENGELMP